MGMLLNSLPNEFWLLLLQVAALLIIVGARKTGMKILGTVCLLAFFLPFIRSLGGFLPTEVRYLLLIASPLLFLSFLVRFCFGKGVWDEVMGHLLYDLIRLVFLAPFRFLAWLWRGLRRA